MLGLLEKLTYVLTAFTLFAVSSAVAAASLFPGGGRSGFPPALQGSVLATGSWLANARAAQGGHALQLDGGYEPAPSRTAPPRRAPTPTRGAESPLGPVVETFYEEGASIPRAEQVPGIPWLRRRPGVRYRRPRTVPRILHDKYQSLEDALSLTEEGGGQFVETAHGTGYQVDWLKQDSLLATLVGLRPGDQLLAINGQPIGPSVSAGRALFEHLREAKRVAVLVERRGELVVLTFEVSGR